MDTRKDEDIIVDLETMKEEMVKDNHFDDAAVISKTLKYIRSFDIKLEGYTRKNEELIATITTLADQADTKKNNLINFHSANILQGLLIKDSSLGDNTIVGKSIGLARLMIERLKDED